MAARRVAGRPGDEQTAGGVAVLSPSGVLDREVLEQLEVELGSRTTPVIVDLSDCTLGATDVLSELGVGRWRRASGDVCLVCRRLTGRRLLARAGVRMVVFTSVGDAVQAWVLSAAGYGSGWA